MIRIAIVGRPNVGKSTLFNRLAGRKLALVDDRPGVTRDRRVATGRLGDLDLELIDTAGFEDVEGRKPGGAHASADRAGAGGRGRRALRHRRARGRHAAGRACSARSCGAGRQAVILVANKSEGRAGDAGALEAFRLGLGDPVAISAEHGEGLADLYAAIDARRAGRRGREDEDAAETAASASPSSDGPTPANRPWSTGWSARTGC